MAVKKLRIEIPTPHDAQKRILGEAKRFNVLDCGRRWGKTTLGINLVVPPVLDGYPVAWFAPKDKYVAEVWRETERILAPVTKKKNAQDYRLELITGGVFEIWNLRYPEDVARGRRYKRAIIDEAAMVPNLRGAWLQAIRPTLMDFKGDAWFLSTPKGFNYFHTLYMNGQDVDSTDWRSWQLPTETNPYITEQEIADIAKDLPDKEYQQEIMAEFMSDSAQVLRNLVPRSIGKPQYEPTHGHKYVIGVDWGRDNDFSAFSVWDINEQREVWLDRSNKIDYHAQRARLKALNDRYRPSRIIAELNSIGAPNIEQLVLEHMPVEPFLTTNATKAEAVDTMILGLESNRVTLLSPKTIIYDQNIGQIALSEGLAFESTRTPTGLMHYGAPESGHDDTVMSRIIAYSAVAPHEDGALELLKRRVERMREEKEAINRKMFPHLYPETEDEDSEEEEYWEEEEETEEEYVILR